MYIFTLFAVVSPENIDFCKPFNNNILIHWRKNFCYDTRSTKKWGPILLGRLLRLDDLLGWQGVLLNSWSRCQLLLVETFNSGFKLQQVFLDFDGWKNSVTSIYTGQDSYLTIALNPSDSLGVRLSLGSCSVQTIIIPHNDL